ncbi:phosphate ABC transporter permease PstA [Halobacterium zhouii]|uniref:phosphate ABC transporter permease PstA n=1 Tax=Halobacterium zhouii TaxID=2902624 RepID=UPI001E406E61|nr:phosphate ABC transporter permease PstA [Halobacterium zhouii]
MSALEENALVSTETTFREYVSTGVMALGALLFLASWGVLFQWLNGETPVLGAGPVPSADLFTVFGALLVVMAVGIASVGAASRLGYVSATPSSTAGHVVGLLFGTVGFVTGGLVASQTIGMGPTGWVATAFVFGVGVAALGVLPREDVGSTFPPAVFLAFLGVLFVTGTIDTGWSWSPGDISATFVGSILVPCLTIVASLVGSWSAAKARAGFGTRGRERGAFYLVRLSVLGMLGVLALLVGFIVVNGFDTLTTNAHVGLGGHVDLPWIGYAVPFLDVKVPFVTNVSQSLFIDVPGLAPSILGTLWLVLGAMLFAVPLGLAAAIFLAEYTESRRFRQVVEVATNGLWSTPSIVFGLFGLAFLVPRIGGGKSLLAGQLVLGFMLLPLVVITSYESITAVPDEYRDASAALGVSQWQTIRSTVLPAAMPGVITGIILGVGRIAGETAPLLLVYGGSPFSNRNPNVLSRFEFSTSPPFVSNAALMERGSALPYQLYTSITSGRLPGQGAPFSVEEFGWGTALVLLIVVLSFYAVGIASRVYFRRKLSK